MYIEILGGVKPHTKKYYINASILPNYNTLASQTYSVTIMLYYIALGYKLQFSLRI